jgi:hypothetical protein
MVFCTCGGEVTTLCIREMLEFFLNNYRPYAYRFSAACHPRTTKIIGIVAANMSVDVHVLLSVLAAAMVMLHWALQQPRPPDLGRRKDKKKGLPLPLLTAPTTSMPNAEEKVNQFLSLT